MTVQILWSRAEAQRRLDPVYLAFYEQEVFEHVAQGGVQVIPTQTSAPVRVDRSGRGRGGLQS